MSSPQSPGDADPPARTTLTYSQEESSATQVYGRPTSGLMRGSRVQRYTILDRVGAGGMGVVYAAYDPSLDRRVALKFLLSQEPERQGVREVRLLREAQAMARLSHPNVAVVYEVGTFEETLFVAMEFIDGVDVREWLTEAPRSRPEIMRVFLAAGRGLAAAHAAGIVHRDFKPENVLLDEHGRPRVTDFGLSRSSGEGEPEDDEAREFRAETVMSLSVTRTGGQIGTPSYMAPEQCRGAEADARSDQFAFCVALFEALHGARPFQGSTLAETAEAIEERRIESSSADVPRWLRAVVERGLAPRPEDRWPSMDALLEALGRDPRAARRRWLLGGAIAAGLVAIGSLWLSSSEVEACPPARDRVAGIWDPPTRARVRAAFLATGSPNAADAFERVDRALDRRLSTWVQAHREACVATRVRGEQSEAVLDLRMQCLERARRQIAALPEVWASGVKVDDAVRTALAVGELEGCSDAESLAAPIAPPRDPDKVRQREAIERLLDRLVTARRAGQTEASLTQAREGTEKARQLGYAPLLGEALFRNGEIEADFGEREAGIRLLHEAFRVANEAHDDARAATVARLLLFYSVWTDSRTAEADLLWKMAEAATARVPGRPDLLAELLGTQGSVLSAQGKNVEAAERLRRALALQGQLHPGDEYAVAATVGNLSSVLADLGQFDEARVFAERGRAAREQTLGPDHPYVAIDFQNLALLDLERADFAAAERSAERGLAIRSKAFPPDHPEVATAVASVAYVQKNAGREDEGRALYERAVRIREKALGPDHAQTAFLRYHLADLAARRGDIAEARRLIDLVLPVMRKTYGELHGRTAYAYLVLGNVLLQEGRAPAAREAYDKALAAWRTADADGIDATLAMNGSGRAAIALGDPAAAIASFEQARAVLDGKPSGIHRISVVPIVAGLGRAHVEAGHRAEGVALLETAVRLAEENGAPSRFDGARARFELAGALWSAGDRSRAVDRARAALEVLAPRPEAEAVRRWLDRHDPPPTGGLPARPAR